jgi:hypothetical protein
MDRRSFAALAIAALTAPAALASNAFAASPPGEWDGLVKVKSKRLKAVYLLPGADFRHYASIELEPTEVAFRKNWLRDYNSANIRSRIREEDAQKIAEEMRGGFQDVFSKAYAGAGYALVTAPGPQVLKVRTAVINLYVNAPDTMSAGRSKSYSVDAGGATLVVEARDSDTGALMGRAVDSRVAGNGSMQRRTSITNESDFRSLFADWAKASIDGLAELKRLSPIAG